MVKSGGKSRASLLDLQEEMVQDSCCMTLRRRSHLSVPLHMYCGQEHLLGVHLHKEIEEAFWQLAGMSTQHGEDCTLHIQWS